MMWVMDEGRGRRTITSIGGLLGGPNLWPLLAVAFGLGALIEAFAYASPSDRAPAMVANVAVAIPLAFAFRWRLWAAVAVTVMMMIQLSGAVVITGSAVVAQLIALFVVAESFGPLVSAPFAVPYLLNAFLNWSGGAPGFSDLLPFVLVIAAIALGSLWRLRDRAIAERDESRREAADSLRERAAMEERARIARELHDVVAHHVSKIAVQAEVGRVADPDVSASERARLTEIGEIAREALGEMRRVLGVLREDAGGGGERAPQPGLADLEELINDARASGSGVRISLSGRVVPLAQGVDLSAYRIVQEALTNARRHAPGATVEVEMRFEPSTLHIRVSDDGPGPSSGSLNGHGLQGIRERVVMVGGTVRTGAGQGGGFVVEADLPIEAAPIGDDE
jgi:signal transduction histidine kinase